MSLIFTAASSLIQHSTYLYLIFQNYLNSPAAYAQDLTLFSNRRFSGSKNQCDFFYRFYQIKISVFLRKEVEIAGASMKKSKSVGVENIPEKLVQIGDETIIDVSTQISNSPWRTRK